MRLRMLLIRSVVVLYTAARKFTGMNIALFSWVISLRNPRLFWVSNHSVSRTKMFNHTPFGCLWPWHKVQTINGRNYIPTQGNDI
ncbi:hypothetical protein FN846DRAFT_946977 [Sphaerosporella brunnea]|uniref:Secreted protein n=1 Tax=Sphaerosporella brunnea TaxID=1250544 RepID=A0A5J5EYB9_9PEZI|nr:hypothetical protein FN846DRAFT_946977 [Sphaerosporella brunnea]